MNLFELCVVATPVFGAMGGGMALKNSGALTTTSGIAVGLCVGVCVVALVRFSFRVLAKRKEPRLFERHQWIAPLLVVFLIPVSLPVLALWLSHFIVLAGLHL